MQHFAICFTLFSLPTSTRALWKTAVAASVVAFSVAAGAQTLSKSFSPTTINDGGTTVLTFTLTSPSGAPAASNVGFVDTLPSGLRVASPASVGGTCANAAAATIANAGAGSITVTNLQLQPGPSVCTVTVNVTNASGQVNGTCAGNPSGFTNASANVTVSNAIDGVAPSCLVVSGGVAPALVQIPTLGQWALLLLATLLAVVAIRQRQAPRKRDR
jgi:uncharacterized repeat protein (TIGR01451 family)